MRPRGAILLAILPLTAVATEPVEPGLPANVREAASSLEEVVVTGEWPGPRLWKVSDGDHVLWLLGTPDLLPKKMVWNSGAVEAVIANSQEVIGRPSISVKGGPIAKLRLYLQWRRLQESADHSSLSAALPADLYGRFETLKQKFASRDSRIEELRPMLAAERLFERAVDASGLTNSRAVTRTVTRLARRHRVRVQEASFEIEDPKAVLNELAAAPRESEIRCLEKIVERLETDLPAMTQRSNAWATGDMKSLASLSYPDNRAVCTDVLSNLPRIAELLARSDRDWMSAAELALSANASTLGLRPIGELLKPDGLVRQFRDKGYQVEEP